jgi:hypothetical protein
MGLFRKSHARHARHAAKTTRAQRRAAERTAQAEAKPAPLPEQQVPGLASETRSEVHSQVNPAAPQ